MAIIYVPKYQEYVGLSTDDKTGITTEASIIYYSNTKKRQILHGGVWGDYVVNTDAILNTSDLQIGAVEIKNSTDDTRMTVGANGAHVDVRSIQAGTNHIGKTGYTLKKVSATFTRPNDITQYAVGDAVTNSTSAPTVFQLDLASIGAVVGQSVEIRKVAIVSSAKQATLPLINVYLSPTTFTATNDNSALDIDDTTVEAGGCWLQCETQNYTASNSRVANIGIHEPMILAVADTKMYGVLQSANAYTPVAQEKFTIILWIALL